MNSNFYKIYHKFFDTYNRYLSYQIRYYKEESEKKKVYCKLEKSKGAFVASIRCHKDDSYKLQILKSLKIDELITYQQDTTKEDVFDATIKNIDIKNDKDSLNFSIYLSLPKNFRIKDPEFGYLVKRNDKSLLYKEQKRKIEEKETKSLVVRSLSSYELDDEKFLEHTYYNIFPSNVNYDPDHNTNEGENEKEFESIGTNFGPSLLKNEISKLKLKIENYNGYTQLQGFDKFQSYCIDSILKKIQKSFNFQNSIPNLCFIWGPPGTGKTTVITEICQRVISEMNDSKILISSFTNIAVDNVLERLLGKDNLKIIRNGSEGKVRHSLKSITRAVDFENIDQYNIIGATLDSLLFPKWDTHKFDLGIIDEASMASLPKLINIFSKCNNVVLVGDFFQLHPFDDVKGLKKENEDSSKKKFEKCASFSYFSYLCLRLLKSIKEETDITTIPLYPLIYNRRSREGLVEFVNDKIYSSLMEFTKKEIPDKNEFADHCIGQLIDNKSFKPTLISNNFFDSRKILDSNNLNNIFDHGILVHVRKWFKFNQIGGSSYANLSQIAVTILLIQSILSFYRNKTEGFSIIKEIGVISLFNFHIQILKRWFWDNSNKLLELDKINLEIEINDKKYSELMKSIENIIKIKYRIWFLDNLEIGTVEKFQGREKKIIITNTVYNPVYTYVENHIAFSDYKKLNVILTRAKDYHFIISKDFEYKTGFFIDLLSNNSKHYVYKNHKMQLKDIEDTLLFDQLFHLQKSTKALKGELVKAVKDITGDDIKIGERDAFQLATEESSSNSYSYIYNKEEDSILQIVKAFKKQFNPQIPFDKNTRFDTLLYNAMDDLIDSLKSSFEEDIHKNSTKGFTKMGKRLFEILISEEFRNALQSYLTSDSEDFFDSFRKYLEKVCGKNNE